MNFDGEVNTFDGKTLTGFLLIVLQVGESPGDDDAVVVETTPHELADEGAHQSSYYYFLVGIAYQSSLASREGPRGGKNRLIKFINVATQLPLHNWILATIQPEDERQLNHPILKQTDINNGRPKRSRSYSEEGTRWIDKLCPWIETCDGDSKCKDGRQTLPGLVQLGSKDCLDWQPLENQTSLTLICKGNSELANQTIHVVGDEMVSCRIIKCYSDESDPTKDLNNELITLLAAKAICGEADDPNQQQQRILNAPPPSAESSSSPLRFPDSSVSSDQEGNLL